MMSKKTRDSIAIVQMPPRQSMSQRGQRARDELVMLILTLRSALAKRPRFMIVVGMQAEDSPSQPPSDPAEL